MSSDMLHPNCMPGKKKKSFELRAPPTSMWLLGRFEKLRRDDQFSSKIYSILLHLAKITEHCIVTPFQNALFTPFQIQNYLHCFNFRYTDCHVAVPPTAISTGELHRGEKKKKKNSKWDAGGIEYIKFSIKT